MAASNNKAIILMIMGWHFCTIRYVLQMDYSLCSLFDHGCLVKERSVVSLVAPKHLKKRMPNVTFKPKLIPTLATLIVLPIFISLGFWQLQRAEEKKILLQQYEQRAGKPLQLHAIKSDGRDYQYSLVKLTGHFDNEHNFLLDNKIYQKRVGYQVLTPFIIDNEQQLILINRGWIPQGQSRQILPTIATVSGEQTLQGSLYIPPKNFILSATEENNTWPRVVQGINIVAFEKNLGQSLRPWIVLLDPKDKNGFVREWQPVVATAPQKNIGYAVQWFSFAGVLCVIYIFLNLKRKK